MPRWWTRLRRDRPRARPAPSAASMIAGMTGNSPARTGWCSRSCVAMRMASKRPAATVATSNAARPMLYTASSRVRREGSRLRLSCVGMENSGTYSTTRSSAGTGTPTQVRRPFSATTTCSPPRTAGATLSAWPSSSAARANTAASSSGPPSSVFAPMTPAALATALAPSPRPSGMGRSTRAVSAGGSVAPARLYVSRAADTIMRSITSRGFRAGPARVR